MVGLTIRKAGLAMNERQNDMCAALVRHVPGTFRRLMGSESGQGTTEYAILVGVLVVIAILSIVTFRDKVQQLWDAIANGMGSL
jgi:Flp pilus assembly pilin Flp